MTHEEFVQAVRRMRGYQRRQHAVRGDARKKTIEDAKGLESQVDAMLARLNPTDAAPSLRRALNAIFASPECGARARSLAALHGITPDVMREAVA